MLKTSQFKTQCKGDIHSSKTANIILPGLMTEYRWTPLRVQNRIQVQMHPWMLVETTHVTEYEYYFACTRKGVHPYSVMSPGKMIFAVLELWMSSLHWVLNWAVFNIYICSFLECHLMGQIKVNLYSIVTLKLKSCLKDFNLRVTMYVFA